MQVDTKKLAVWMCNNINILISVDRIAIEGLIETRTKANDLLSDLPKIRVTENNELGLLGILNSFVLPDYLLAAMYREGTGELLSLFAFTTRKYTCPDCGKEDIICILPSLEMCPKCCGKWLEERK